MSMLLAQFQQMRLIRERNLLTLKLTRITTKKNRITKSIAATQKRYTSRTANIENIAKRMITQAKTYFQSCFGLGMNNGVQLNNYMGSNNFIMGRTAQYIKNFKYKDENGNEATYNGALAQDPSNIQKLFTEIAQNGGYPASTKGEDGKVTYTNGWDDLDIKVFNQAKYAAQNDLNSAQMMTNTMSANYEQNIEIWKEANLTQIEDEQEAALSPLNYEDTMLDLEKTSIEIQLENIKAQLESYKGLASEGAKESAPRFGQ